MIWYFSDLGRWKQERLRLETLAQEADWFRPIGWRMDDNFRLILDADIAAGGRIYPVVLRYPNQFPYTPPSVLPRDDDSRWSNHQFGAGGELCLEYGPDTWTPDLTGDLLMHSARRLLDGENPPSGQAGRVASRHRTTLGQRLRAERTHLLITHPLIAFLSGIPMGVSYTGNLLGAFHEEVTANFIDTITAPDGTTWRDTTVPATISHQLWGRPVTIFRIPADAPFTAPSKASALKVTLASFGLSFGTYPRSHIARLPDTGILPFRRRGQASRERDNPTAT